MTLLVLGLVLWTLAHGVKIHAPARRAALAESLGEGPTKILFAVLALASVGLMVKGSRRCARIFGSALSPRSADITSAGMSGNRAR